MDADHAGFLVEKAGATFIEATPDSIVFRDCESGATVSLFLSAIRDLDDILAALRRTRERLQPAGWELAPKT